MRSRGARLRTVSHQTAVCLAVSIVAEIGLRTLPLPRLVSLLGLQLSSSELPSHPPIVLPRWTRGWLQAADRVLRFWPAGPPGKCLRRALVTGNRLRALHPQLVIGVKHDGRSVGAHAWLVVAGGALDPTAGDWQQIPLAGRRTTAP